jgi:metallo-beta-lactamase family protein
MRLVNHQAKEQLKRVFLVHGELESINALARDIDAEGYSVTVPEKGITYEL